MSLVEVMVATAVGASVVAFGLVVTGDFNRGYQRHAGSLDSARSLRSALELIAQDVRQAGVGVGYTADGEFPGLVTGNFTVQGAAFSAEGRAVSTVDGPMTVQDLGLRRATGTRRTVLWLDPSGEGEICAGLSFEPEDLSIVADRGGRRSRTVRVLSSSPSGCVRGLCTGGCTSIQFEEDDAWVSDPAAREGRAQGGDLFSRYESVVWFVAADDRGQPELRRVGSLSPPCADADAGCGELAAPGVLWLRFRVHRHDGDGWIPVGLDRPLMTEDRLRVDLELAGRAPSDPGVGPMAAVASQMDTELCAPAPCGSGSDRVPRAVARTTVEVKNAGQMRIR